MHTILILFTLLVAVVLRLLWQPSQGSWPLRWQNTLFGFLFPPLWLLTTAIAILWMGPKGKMIGVPIEAFSYWWVIGSFILALAVGIKLTWQAKRSQIHLTHYPQVPLNCSTKARLLPDDTPYIAQVGLGHPQLVITQGLLETLDTEHLQAVLLHEQAHVYYQDTFWFFLLGWVRSLTRWLPKTQLLWNELLMLRELRADHWAKQKIDPLLLAESLLLVISSSLYPSEVGVAALNSPQTCDRLSERINALLTENSPENTINPWQWSWFVLTLFPLLLIPFHN